MQEHFSVSEKYPACCVLWDCFSKYKRNAIPVTSCEGPQDWDIMNPIFKTVRSHMVVQLLALCPSLPKKFPGTYFCYRLVNPRATE
jgi:hypothetical protein